MSNLPTQFTPARQVRFCDDLAGHGNVRLACARAGVSAQTAYRIKRRDPVFARCWEAALGLARDHTEAVLAERALEGVEEAVFYHGEEIARRRRYCSRLLLAHLGRLDRLCEAQAAAKEPVDFDLLLAELGLGEDAGMLPREEFVAEHAADAEREALDALYAAEEAGEEWDEAASDRLVAVTREARAEAGEAWDERQVELYAAVDGLVAGDGPGDEVPADLPYEIKSSSPPPTPPASGRGARLAKRSEASRSGVGRTGDFLPLVPCHMCHPPESWSPYRCAT